MKVKIIKCSNPKEWYSKKIGEIFKVLAYDTRFANVVIQTADGSKDVDRIDVVFVE